MIDAIPANATRITKCAHPQDHRASHCIRENMVKGRAGPQGSRLQDQDRGKERHSGNLCRTAAIWARSSKAWNRIHSSSPGSDSHPPLSQPEPAPQGNPIPRTPRTPWTGRAPPRRPPALVDVVSPRPLCDDSPRLVRLLAGRDTQYEVLIAVAETQ